MSQDKTLTDIIRSVGGIVHSDGNIFFKDAASFQKAAHLERTGQSVTNDAAGGSSPIGRADLSRFLQEWNDNTGALPRNGSWLLEIEAMLEAAYDLLAAQPSPERNDCEPVAPDAADLATHSWPIQEGGLRLGVPNGVLLVHKPTGIGVAVTRHRSQHQNRDEARTRLFAMLAAQPFTEPKDCTRCGGNGWVITGYGESAGADECPACAAPPPPAERHYCERCGKRLDHTEGVHTCTPPGDATRSAGPESRQDLLARLHREAEAGVQSDVGEVDALEFRRDQYGLNRGEFAAVLGLRNSHYSDITTGRRRLPINAVARAVAVGVPVEPLLAVRAAATKEPQQ